MEVGGGGQLSLLDGGGRDGGGGGGDGSGGERMGWHGLSQAVHMVQVDWSLETDVEVLASGMKMRVKKRDK